MHGAHTLNLWPTVWVSTVRQSRVPSDRFWIWGPTVSRPILDLGTHSPWGTFWGSTCERPTSTGLEYTIWASTISPLTCESAWSLQSESHSLTAYGLERPMLELGIHLPGSQQSESLQNESLQSRSPQSRGRFRIQGPLHLGMCSLGVTGSGRPQSRATGFGFDLWASTIQDPTL